MPLAVKPAAIALVVPVLTPARPFSPKPAAIGSNGNHDGTFTSPGDDLQAALTAAREAAASAERTLAALTKLSRSRSGGVDRSRSAADALSSANTALIALQAAVAADPGNSSLERALAETERAIKSLARNPDRRNSAGRSSSENH
jgi:hypothetical protein